MNNIVNWINHSSFLAHVPRWFKTTCSCIKNGRFSGEWSETIEGLVFDWKRWPSTTTQLWVLKKDGEVACDVYEKSVLDLMLGVFKRVPRCSLTSTVLSETGTKQCSFLIPGIARESWKCRCIWSFFVATPQEEVMPQLVQNLQQVEHPSRVAGLRVYSLEADIRREFNGSNKGCDVLSSYAIVDHFTSGLGFIKHWKKKNTRGCHSSARKLWR